MLLIWRQKLQVNILNKILLITQLILQNPQHVSKLWTFKLPFSLLLLIFILWQNGKAK